MAYNLSIGLFTLIIMIISSIIDLRTKKIPNYITIPFIVISFIIFFLHNETIVVSSLICVLIWFLLFGIGIAGGGDVKLLMGITLLFGWLSSIEILFFGSISLFIYVLITNKKETKEQMKDFWLNIKIKEFSSFKTGKSYPFAPHLTIGFIVTAITNFVQEVCL